MALADNWSPILQCKLMVAAIIWTPGNQSNNEWTSLSGRRRKEREKIFLANGSAVLSIQTVAATLSYTKTWGLKIWQGQQSIRSKSINSCCGESQVYMQVHGARRSERVSPIEVLKHSVVCKVKATEPSWDLCFSSVWSCGNTLWIKYSLWLQVNSPSEHKVHTHLFLVLP